MKLIVSELGALKGYVSREFYFIMTELIEAYGWKHVETFKLLNARGSLKERILREAGEMPEAILFWESYSLLNPRGRDVLDLPCLKCFFADDIHWWHEDKRFTNYVSFLLCDVILSPYAYRIDEFYPGLAGLKRVVWVPHSASPDFLICYNERPENAILLSGAIDDCYPLRQKMMQLYEQRSYPIVFQRHPGYHCQHDYDVSENVGRNYAKKINQYRAAFTDCLTFKYVVAKYFEIPATGALLLADGAVSGPLKELGFIPGEHYIPVSADNMEERIRYVLDERNHTQTDEIRRRAQTLVREKHKSSDRARLIDEACSQ
ncbi:MAG TPA: glycosyltransferase [Blastocatellia bacterium]|jgi:hypothetical protein